MTEPKPTEVKVVGRNEACPCRSGKKYKRCCGVNAAPKLTVPKDPFPTGLGMDGSDALEGVDPAMLGQFTQALQKLPKGQMQRLQTLMQKAMSGKDIKTEAEEFEKSLPPDFQEMIQAWTLSAGLGAETEVDSSLEALPAPSNEQGMTEDQARALIAQAASEGKISHEQADSLLHGNEATKSLAPPTEFPIYNAAHNQSSESKIGKFWKNLGGKKNI